MDHQLTCPSVNGEDEVDLRYPSRLKPPFAPSPSNLYTRTRMHVPISPQRQHVNYADYTIDPRRYRSRGHFSKGDCDFEDDRRISGKRYYQEDSNLSSPRHFHGHSISDPVKHSNYYISPEDSTFTTAEVHCFPSAEDMSAETYVRKRSSHYNKPSTSTRSSAYRDDFQLADSEDFDELMSSRLASMTTSEVEAAKTPIKWNRANITATMERFEPMEYCYAYNEPNTSNHNVAIPSTSRSKSNFHNTSSFSRSAPPRGKACKYSYITRYGTEENIYEEIADKAKNSLPKHRHPQQQSLISLNQSMMEEELRRVENRHKRILGELNLSVEAMLMPDIDSIDSEKVDNVVNVVEHVGPTDDLLSPSSCNPLADLDSGFSGSSSGASYVGSLRLKSGLERARSSLSFPRDSPAVGGSTLNISYSNKDQRIVDENLPQYGERCSRTSNGNSPSARSSSCGDSAKNSSFWNKKSWKKLPGFSSSNTINKTGLSVSPGENWWLRWIP